MNNEVLKIDIAGRQETLPILNLGNGIKIAFFNLHGNQELTEFCGKNLAKLAYGAEILITAESKGLQLCHCTARELGHKFYAVARKSRKLYMQDDISVEVKSITTGNKQRMFLSAHDAQLLKGKRVAIIDDVVSTGGSVKALEELVELAGGKVVSRCCVLAEGDAGNRQDIQFLSTIPLMKE